MTDRYRYGGPVPERAQWLKKRREWRASSLFATVKRGRARDREEAAKAGDVSKRMAMAAEMTPYLTALQGRPGKEPSPWIAHPASAPKSGAFNGTVFTISLCNSSCCCKGSSVVLGKT